MAGTAEIIIGIILFILGIIFIIGAVVSHNNNPLNDRAWTWPQIILLSIGIILGIIGLVLIGIGIYKKVRSQQVMAATSIELREVPFEGLLVNILEPEIPKAYTSRAQKLNYVRGLMESCNSIPTSELRLIIDTMHGPLKTVCQQILERKIRYNI